MEEHRRRLDIRRQSDRRAYLFLAGLSVILLLCFAFLDLQIARAAYQPESRFGHLLRNFGELPGHVMIFFAAGIYLLYGKNLFIRVIMLVPFCLEIWILIDKHHSPGSFLESAFVAFLVLIPIATMLFSLRFFSLPEIARNAGLIVLAGVLHPLFLVQIMKKIWGRVRFRNLIEDMSDYTPWYLPRGFTGSQSFPSGHTAMGILVCFLVLFVPRHLRALAFIPLFAWALAVGASRIVLGAHYASDVAFSILAGLGLLLLFNRLSAPVDDPLQGRSKIPNHHE